MLSRQRITNKGADQTARMHRLICVFVVRIWHMFSHDVAELESSATCCMWQMRHFIKHL